MGKLDARFIARVRRKDRIATRIITVGGMLIIASVIAILVLIFKVALPLFLGAEAKQRATVDLSRNNSSPPLAIGIDDYEEVAFTVSQDGTFSFFTLANAELLSTFATAPAEGLRIKHLEPFKNSSYSFLWEDGSLSICQVRFLPRFNETGVRRIEPQVETMRHLPPDQWSGHSVRAAAARISSEDDRLTIVSLLENNRFLITHEITTTDIFDNAETEIFSVMTEESLPGKVTAFALDGQGKTLYAGTDHGNLLRWDLRENESVVRTDNVIATKEGLSITALAFVFGDVSIAVGDSGGNIATWMPVRSEESAAAKKLRRIHDIKPHQSPVISILASRRNKSVYSLDQKGMLHADHMTSENHLFSIQEPFSLIGLNDRDSGIIGLDRNGVLQAWHAENSHPEINWKTLFGKVWYENYDHPEYVWQSSSGNDDFEPKLSIVPLLFGTIKGTIYAMLFSIPLSIFGAVYTSQLTTPAFKKGVKPVIEIMASVPSVVIGFLIALWMAPIVERQIVPVLLSVILLPSIFIIFMLILSPFQAKALFRNRTKGYEFILLVPAFLLTGIIAVMAGPPIEKFLFDGNFTQWLFSEAGMRYDQRNCIIIAFGLGIAVIPIIFSITEDAISNIPPSLTAASLALGASRWQTIWRVVLPSASPGIFAAIMIGFGRAVGETMIVLMATGNTPIIDWSIFNGMRTLSANIAVEIPEAPFGGTLYRVLFLCATILFCLTFVLNTGAELIREHLRKKYGRY